MLQGDGRTAGRLVDDADSLTIGNISAAVSARLVDGEVVELSVTALLTFYIKGEERVAGALEGDELIRERHLLSQRLERLAVGAVGILHLVVVVVADAAEPDFTVGQTDGHTDGVVGELFEAAEGEGAALLDDADPRARNVDVAESADVAVLHALGVEFDGDDRFRADDALGERVAGPHELFCGLRLYAEATATEAPLLVVGVVVPLPDAAELFAVEVVTAVVRRRPTPLPLPVREGSR